MDFSITVAGTFDDADMEDELLEMTQTFVSELEGVTAATFNSPNFMNVDLTEEEEVDETTPEPGDGNGTDEEKPAPEPEPVEDGEE